MVARNFFLLLTAGKTRRLLLNKIYIYFLPSLYSVHITLHRNSSACNRGISRAAHYCLPSAEVPYLPSSLPPLNPLLYMGKKIEPCSDSPLRPKLRSLKSDDCLPARCMPPFFANSEVSFLRNRDAMEPSIKIGTIQG